MMIQIQSILSCLLLLIIFFCVIVLPSSKLFVSAESDIGNLATNLTGYPEYPEFVNKFAVLRQFKLLFCLIEKVGNTAFAKVFRTLPRVNPINWQKWHRIDLWKRHSPYVYNLSTSDLAGILSRGDWVKAVFYRDPLERFLSAFISKCQEKDRDGAKICETVFCQRNATFKQAISVIYQKLAVQQSLWDPHFARQTEFCGGLNNTIQYYNHVHLLNPRYSNAQFVGILKQAGVHIRGLTRTKIRLFFPEVKGDDTSSWVPKGIHYGAAHQTNSSDLSQLLRYYSHPCYVHAVIRYYQSDYAVFRLPYPGWTQPHLQQMTLTQCISWAVKEQQKQQQSDVKACV